MEELEFEFKNVLTIYKNEFIFEYNIDTKEITLNWIDEEGEDFSILLYDTEWNLEESPIKDLTLLELYLKTFKEFK